MRICVHMCACRYMGVDMGDGMYDRDAVVSGDSNIAFEWCFQSAGGGVRRDVVTPMAGNVAKRGIPAPECTRKAALSIWSAMQPRQVQVQRCVYRNILVAVTCPWLAITSALWGPAGSTSMLRACNAAPRLLNGQSKLLNANGKKKFGRESWIAALGLYLSRLALLLMGGSRVLRALPARPLPSYLASQ